MRNLDDFDLRPGDPGNPRRPAPRPADAARAALFAPGSDIDLPPGDAGNAGARRRSEPDLRRYAQSGPAFDSTRVDERRAAGLAAAKPPRYAAASSPRTQQPRAGIVVTLLVAVALVVAFWMMSRRVEPPAPGTVANEEESRRRRPTRRATSRSRSAELEAPLPPLDQSDALVRELVGALSSNPALARLARNCPTWSAPSPPRSRTPAWAAPRSRTSPSCDRASRIASSSARAPNGTELVTDPGELPSLRPGHRRLHVDRPAGGGRRLPPAARADAGGVRRARLPRRELRHRARDRVRDAAPDARSPPPRRSLEQHLNTYHYADPRLEALQPAQKQLLRMGPDNAAPRPGPASAAWPPRSICRSTDPTPAQTPLDGPLRRRVASPPHRPGRASMRHPSRRDFIRYCGCRRGGRRSRVLAAGARARRRGRLARAQVHPHQRHPHGGARSGRGLPGGLLARLPRARLLVAQPGRGARRRRASAPSPPISAATDRPIVRPPSTSTRSSTSAATSPACSTRSRSRRPCSAATTGAARWCG